MISNEEVLPILIKGMLQSFVSDGATSAKDPTNQCLHGPELQMCNAQWGNLHTVTQQARGIATPYVSLLGFSVYCFLTDRD